MFQKSFDFMLVPLLKGYLSTKLQRIPGKLKVYIVYILADNSRLVVKVSTLSDLEIVCF